MRKLTMAAAAAAMILAPGLAWAQTAIWAGLMKAPPPSESSSRPVEGAACRGWGPYCPPGYVRACGPYRCWCRPCW